MADAPKTLPTEASVADFIAAVPDARRRAEADTVCRMLEEVSGHPPVMWGPSIVGFGRYQYVYASGREGIWPIIGFSPRKTALTLYIMAGFEAARPDLMARLGPVKTSVSCLYIPRLDKVDVDALRDLCVWDVETMRDRYPA
ncbi:DUF1801 domain-containing protein [uncultured Brevundimonas sp.]|uniref:DUF1801 domain-containing protein n=1 Tax=uncultured Brevundimonas sp. TaxID=213418 RepID=UPI0030EB3D0F|tara:strand:+ start:482 stop:907 length:426 start_codon:yes stop_codon:yes gene_type:complete